MDDRHQRREAAPLHDLAAGQRHRAHRAAVKRAEERDHVLPARVIAGQLERRLDRLGPAIGEEDPLGDAARRDLGELLRQVDLRRVVEIGARHVQQLGRLLLNGRDDPRMAMAGRADGDAGREIEKQIAVDVLDDRPVAALDRQRIDARVRRRRVLLVGRNELAARGPGSSRPNPRHLQSFFSLGHKRGSRRHNALPNSTLRPDSSNLSLFGFALVAGHKSRL